MSSGSTLAPKIPPGEPMLLFHLCSHMRFALGIRWLILLALAGLLVVAHGCHGNEDHELFAQAAAVAK